MKVIRWFSGLLHLQISPAGARGAAGIAASALLIAAAGVSAAQGASPTDASGSKMSLPTGYTTHQSVDVGGRMNDVVGSGDMYDTFVNQHTGPRLFDQSFEMQAQPGKKNTLVDDLSLFSSGFGGDPYTLARLNASKAKVYEFSGVFRRNRPYSNYDLLANPNIPSGQSIGNVSAGTLVPVVAWPLVNKSPVMYNTVRRMSDGNLTLMPLATFTLRLGYNHSTMEGPTLSPAYTPMGMEYNALLRKYERNGSDDFLGAIDWKPTIKTKITFEAQANHYKMDTFFTLDPNGFYLQESDGTPVYLGSYTSLVPYPFNTTTSTTPPACASTSMGTAFTSINSYTILSPSSNGGPAIINPACAVITSTFRQEKTRTWTPTQTLRFESSAVKNLIVNGDVHYTRGRLDMPSYYESSQGLNGVIRSGISSGGNGTVQHTVIGSNFGVIWKVSAAFNIGDQVTYSSTHEAGSSIIPAPVTLQTPADTATSKGNETIFYAGTLTPGTGSLPHGINGTLTYNYFGQEYLINYLTLGWDATSKARFSFTYRHTNRNIGQGVPHQGPIPIKVSDPVSGTITINEDAGIFNAGLRLAKNWSLNGTVEAGYADNAFTAIAQRQFQQYRVHTQFKANGWTTITGSFSDRERHNNTNNNADAVAAGDNNYNGPINHVDHSRIVSAGAVLAPSDRFSFDFNYSYSDVYSATNVCFTSATAPATPVAPAIAGAATETSPGSGIPNFCLTSSTNATTGAVTDSYATWYARDFEDLPSQYVSAAFAFNPTKKVGTGVGYSLSDVNGSRFFNDARDVNGMVVSKYQSPYVKLSYALHPGLVFNGVFNYYGYSEPNTPSGAPLCTTTAMPASWVLPASPPTITTTTMNIQSCATIGVVTGLTEGKAGATQPRDFHANNVTLGFHYEF